MMHRLSLLRAGRTRPGGPVGLRGAAARDPAATTPRRPGGRAAHGGAFANQHRLRALLCRRATAAADRGLLRTDGGGADTPITARTWWRISNASRCSANTRCRTGGSSRARPRRRCAAGNARCGFRPISAPRCRRTSATRTGRGWRATATGCQASPAIPSAPSARAATSTSCSSTATNSAMRSPLLRRIMPNIGDTTIREITTLPRHEFCAVYAMSNASAPHVYVAAIAFIRAEHPDLMRRVLPARGGGPGPWPAQ